MNGPGGVWSGDGWIILRTAGRSTIRLAGDLRRDGFDVWTPVREMKVRRARWSAHREINVPLMASFIFARQRHLLDLLEIADRPGAGFSVFRHLDRFPLIADHDLDPLREEEAAPVTPDQLLGIYRRGEKVHVVQGIFGGMAGVVERGDGTHTLVRFGSKLRVKISTFILKPICGRTAAQTRKGIAAKAA